jgi:hypothetical protein
MSEFYRIRAYPGLPAVDCVKGVWTLLLWFFTLESG